MFCGSIRRRRTIGALTAVAIGLSGITLGVASPASAAPVACPGDADTTFIGPVGDELWSTPANWTNGLPSPSSDICVQAGASMVITSLQSVGSIFIAPGASVRMAFSAPAINLNGGTYAAKVVNSGTLTGYGRINGFVENHGTISPGGAASAGTLVFSSYWADSTGNLGLDWFNNSGTAGTSYDRVQIDGNAALNNSSLTVSTPNGAVMSADVLPFTAVTYATYTGGPSLVYNAVETPLVGTVGSTSVSFVADIPATSISGKVTNDWNYSGTNDADEPPIANVQIYVDSNGNNTFNLGEPTATTAADGTYTIATVPAGTWNVRVNSPALGVTQQPATGLVVAGVPKTNVNPVVSYPGIISGTLTFSNGKPAAGVTVFADQNNDGVRQATEQQAVTDNNGNYQLRSLTPGNYPVKVVGDYTVETAIGTVTVAATLTAGHNGVLEPVAGAVAPGYTLTSGDGGSFAFGGANFTGSLKGQTLNAPIIGGTTLSDSKGSYQLASDGGVFALGTAQFYGSTGGKALNAPIVAMAKTPEENGYFLFAQDGGVFAFGDAQFQGSMGGKKLNAPVVAGGVNADGGYYLVAADGGVFSFGATFHGSTGNLKLNQPIVGMSLTADGSGYYLVAADGGVFAFDAPFYGSTGGRAINAPVVGIKATSDGYFIASRDGGVFAFGSAFAGSAVEYKLDQPVVAIS